MAAVYGFLQARLQAHHGARLDTATWHRLMGAEPFELFLARACSTVLGYWLEAVDPTAGIHHLELRLLEELQRYLAAAASWAPPAWRPAVLWLGKLPNLAIHLHRQGGGAAYSWMLLLEEDHDIESVPVGGDVLSWWLQRWRQLWPQEQLPRRQLEQLIRLLQQHQRSLERLEGGDAAGNARQQLQRHLELLFRRFTLQPSALFVHLALVALDLEQLRGELSRRRLFHTESIT
ncbi:MAG: hypothetical protein HQL60_08385 [Magnetococcales bacterium]|nr:hypothetical protein [Magnetococcales bacterium]